MSITTYIVLFILFITIFFKKRKKPNENHVPEHPPIVFNPRGSSEKTDPPKEKKQGADLISMDYQPMENNMVKMQTEERIPLKSVFAQDKKEDENKEALPSLDDPEEVRKAIIYTEIINRKY